jgi:hypothetical protein
VAVDQAVAVEIAARFILPLAFGAVCGRIARVRAADQVPRRPDRVLVDAVDERAPR